MAGLGKTTLVRKIYEDPDVKKHFKCCAWITVNQKYNVEELLKRLTEQFIRRKISNNMPYDELVVELKAFLKEKRYVAFIDDIWDDNAWVFIQCAFPENEFGSRIMVTTRSRVVANFCAKPLENVFELDPLTDQDAWNLFCKKAFTSDSDNGNCDPKLEPTARKILAKCEGLPLAIVTIGSLLATRAKNPIEWGNIYRSLGTELGGGPVMKFLSLSYNDLDSYLRPCFLYLGIYPPSYEIKRAEISRQWLAEGFIHPVAGLTLEDVSHRNLVNLVQRNLVQVVKVDCFERVESCRIHDLMHEFIVSKSQEVNFHTTCELHGKALRLAIYNDQSFEGNTCNPSQFCSLFLFGSKVVRSLENFHSLKVLSIHGIGMYTFPSSIINLAQLTYLCLRGLKIRDVPKSIENLTNLQTLDLKYTLKELPKGVIHLQGLRHLLVSNGIGLGGVKFPAKLDKLTSMQNLLKLNAKDGGDQLKELGELTQLKRISITSVRSEDGMTLCNSISKMGRLQSLALSPFDPASVLNVSSFSTPSTELRSIKLTGILKKLPNMLLSLASLVKLQLWGSQLNDDPFQALTDLPCLADLRMLHHAYTGEKLYARTQSLANLKTLYIGDLPRQKLITLEQGTMPNLEFWAISDNGQMQRVPLGIEHLNRLNEIHLPPKLLGDVFKEQGEDWRKLQQIPTIRQSICDDGRWYSYPLD